MTEFEKMRASMMYRFDDAEIQASFRRAANLCVQLQTISGFDEEHVRPLLEQLIPGLPATACIHPPFFCDHGTGIRMGEGSFINSYGSLLDGALITIGSRTKLGPHCQLITTNHPTDYLERRVPQETCKPITIGDDTWLGAGVIVLPGVTIGDRCVIGAGSVVTKDIPSDSMAVGNPARVIKCLRKDNR